MKARGGKGFGKGLVSRVKNATKTLTVWTLKWTQLGEITNDPHRNSSSTECEAEATLGGFAQGG